MSIFNRNKYKQLLEVPANTVLEWFSHKVRIVGLKEAIYRFAIQLRALKDLKEGDLIQLDRLTLQVSDFMTSNPQKEHGIALPGHAWNVMGSKFCDVLEQLDDNPFDFNDCGYTGPIPFDMGVEVTDLPLTNELLVQKSHVKLMKSACPKLYLIMEDTEVFHYVEDYLTEQKKIVSDHHMESEINGLLKYRVYFNPALEHPLIDAVNQLDNEELKKIYRLNH